jgi:hypothetical protein
MMLPAEQQRTVVASTVISISLRRIGMSISPAHQRLPRGLTASASAQQLGAHAEPALGAASSSIVKRTRLSRSTKWMAAAGRRRALAIGDDQRRAAAQALADGRRARLAADVGDVAARRRARAT